MGRAPGSGQSATAATLKEFLRRELGRGRYAGAFPLKCPLPCPFDMSVEMQSRLACQVLDVGSFVAQLPMLSFLSVTFHLKTPSQVLMVKLSRQLNLTLRN